MSRRAPSLWPQLRAIVAVICFAIGAAGQTSVQKTDSGSKQPDFANINRIAPLFIENVGQFDQRVLFQLRLANQTIWFTKSGPVFDTFRTVDDAAGASANASALPAKQPLRPLD